MKSGDVVVLNFPFSDLSGAKPRPAVLIAKAGPDDFIACQVTTQVHDPIAIEVRHSDFTVGGLKATSFARPGKLFTAHRSIISKRVGQLNGSAISKLKQAVIDLVHNG